LPKEGPQIEGTRTEYQIGDLINVSCKAGPAKPAAKLMWYINDISAPEQYLREVIVDFPIRGEQQFTETSKEESLKTSFLYLQFEAKSKHFVNSMIRLRCTAVISQVFSKHQEVIAKDERRSKQSKTEHYNYYNTILATNYEGDGPIITGVRHRYSVNDLVNATCTSRRSKPGAELMWFVNDVQVRIQYTRFDV
ncbi:beat protein-like protein, partial [Leptotrombidium deliense]